MDLSFIKEEQLQFLKEGNYIRKDETPEYRFLEILERVKTYEKQYKDVGLSDRLYQWFDKNFISLSTPILSNFGRKGLKSKSTPLPASCNIVTVGDSIEDIYFSRYELAMLSKLGAGVGSNYIYVSQKGTEIEEGFFSNSKLDWIEDDVSTAQKVSQTNRRGYNTPSIYITDNDFDKLMDRIDKSNPNKSDVLINNTVCIMLPHKFWENIKTDKDLQRRFMRVIIARENTGKVYILDEDNCRKNNSPVYNKLGLDNWVTNICTEHIQPAISGYTTVCVLSALNLVHWDKIKENTQIIKDAITFLDIVNEEYITLTNGVPYMKKANRSAKERRDIGLGTLGLAEYFQKSGCAYGDVTSRILNKEIYSTIRKYAEERTVELGSIVGSPKFCEDANMVRRNCSILMVAPNKSTSFISGATSAGVEPFMSNIFVKSLAKIQHVFKNSNLETCLEKYGKNDIDTWRSIEEHNGSVQHLDFMSDEDKSIFRTFSEVSPKDIIDLASDRQVFIDMGQSINLVKRPNYTKKDLYDMHKYAFEKGLKTLYYLYPSSHAILEKEGDSWDSCVSCAD